MKKKNLVTKEAVEVTPIPGSSFRHTIDACKLVAESLSTDVVLTFNGVRLRVDSEASYHEVFRTYVEKLGAQTEESDGEN